MTTYGMWQCLSGMQWIKKDRFINFQQLFYLKSISELHSLFMSLKLELEQLQASWPWSSSQPSSSWVSAS